MVELRDKETMGAGSALSLKPQAVCADTLPMAVHHLRLWLNLG